MCPIYISQNNGDSFIEAESGTLDVNSFATVNEIVVGPESGGNTFWRSSNSGEGWTEITNTGASDTFSSWPQCVKFYNGLNQFVFLGGAGFIWHSEDASGVLTEVDLSTIFPYDFSSQAYFNNTLFLGSESGFLITANFEGSETDISDKLWFSDNQTSGTMTAMEVFNNKLYIFFQNGNVAYSEDGTAFYPCNSPTLFGTNGNVQSNAIPFVYDNKLYSWVELNDAGSGIDTNAFLKTL